MKSLHRVLPPIAAALLFTLSPAMPGEAAGTGINEAQRLVFMNDFLSDVAAGSVLTYDFSHRVQEGDGFTDRVKVTVTGVAEEGRRDLEFDFLTGANHIDFHPARAYKGNPLMIHFLERDIREMSLSTGGSIHYFRNRIRKSFTQPELRHVKIDFQGSEVEAVEVAVTPFAADPNLDRFEMYGNKRYEFLFSDKVPGGLYRIHTTVPGKNGSGVLIEDTLVFHDMAPAG